MFTLKLQEKIFETDFFSIRKIFPRYSTKADQVLLHLFLPILN